MLKSGGNRRNFAEASKLPILARGISDKNSVSWCVIPNILPLTSHLLLVVTTDMSMITNIQLEKNKGIVDLDL